jgi:transcriptional regulator GlxA family with amidase domain
MRIDRDALRRLAHARDLLVHDDAPVSQVARSAGISPFHFIRQFDALFGETPHQFRTRARLDRAKQLLRTGASVTETCMELGFSSVGSFSGLFARRVGVTPSAFRRFVQVQTSFAYRGCFSLMFALPREAFAT